MCVISDNLRKIEERIGLAAAKSGRARQDVTLVAVTKTVGIDEIKEAVELGVTHVGENRAQEIVLKQPAFADQHVNWHMIGHLQTNKVKQVVELACMIHSVHSIKLAAEIDKVAYKLNKIMDVLIEINIAKEQSKYGIYAEDAIIFSKQISTFNNIRLRGIMCVAPFVEKAEENRKYFQKMRNVLIDIQRENTDNSYINCLSMGMTGDFEVAIEEGATIIRVGTGVFGERSLL